MIKKIVLLFLLFFMCLSIGYSPDCELTGSCEDEETLEEKFAKDPAGTITNEGAEAVADGLTVDQLVDAANNNPEVIPALADKPKLQGSVTNMLLSSMEPFEKLNDNGKEDINKVGDEAVSAFATQTMGDNAKVESGVQLKEIGEDGSITVDGDNPTKVADPSTFEENNFPIELKAGGEVGLGEDGAATVSGGEVLGVSCEGGVDCVVQVSEGAEVNIDDAAKLGFEVEFVKGSEGKLQIGEVEIKPGEGGLSVFSTEDEMIGVEGEALIADSDRSLTETEGFVKVDVEEGKLVGMDIVRGGEDPNGKPYDTIVTALNPETNEPILKIDPSMTTTYYPPGTEFGEQGSGWFPNGIGFSEKKSLISVNIAEGNEVNLGMYGEPLKNYQLGVEKDSKLAIGLLTDDGEPTNQGFIVRDGEVLGSNFFEKFGDSIISATILQSGTIGGYFEYNPEEGLVEMTVGEGESVNIFGPEAFKYKGSGFRVYGGNIYESALGVITEGNSDFEGVSGEIRYTGITANDEIYNVENMIYEIPEDNLGNVMEVVSLFPPGASAMALQAITTGIKTGKYEEGMPIAVHDLTTHKIFSVVDGELMVGEAGHTAYNDVSNIENSNRQPMGTSYLRPGVGQYKYGMGMTGLDPIIQDLIPTSIEEAWQIKPEDYGNSNNGPRQIVLHAADQFLDDFSWSNGELKLKKEYTGSTEYGTGDFVSHGCSQFQNPEQQVDVVNGVNQKGGGLIYVGASKGYN